MLLSSKIFGLLLIMCKHNYEICVNQFWYVDIALKSLGNCRTVAKKKSTCEAIGGDSRISKLSSASWDTGLTKCINHHI